jgi:hypothetical protein
MNLFIPREAEVIRHLTDVHPVTLTLSDLNRELGQPQGDAKDDEIEVAVRELVKVGLLERSGERIHLSRAAARYHEIDEFMG